MKELVEVSWQDTEKEEPVTVREQYYLLHFGLRYQIVGETGVMYTVAICQSVRTGQLEYFDIGQIRIIGAIVK